MLKPALVERLQHRHAGRLIKQLKALTVMVGRLPIVKRSPDPEDDHLLATAEAGKADYLITGDKSGLLRLERHYGTRIITARDLAERFVLSPYRPQAN